MSQTHEKNHLTPCTPHTLTPTHRISDNSQHCRRSLPRPLHNPQRNRRAHKSPRRRNLHCHLDERWNLHTTSKLQLACETDRSSRHSPLPKFSSIFPPWISRQRERSELVA